MGEVETMNNINVIKQLLMIKFVVLLVLQCIHNKLHLKFSTATQLHALTPLNFFVQHC